MSAPHADDTSNGNSTHDHTLAPRRPHRFSSPIVRLSFCSTVLRMPESQSHVIFSAPATAQVDIIQCFMGLSVKFDPTFHFQWLLFGYTTIVLRQQHHRVRALSPCSTFREPPFLIFLLCNTWTIRVSRKLAGGRPRYCILFNSGTRFSSLTIKARQYLELRFLSVTSQSATSPLR